MTHHHHQPGHAHPSPPMAASILRMSALQRLAAAALIAVALWAMVLASLWS